MKNMDAALAQLNDEQLECVSHDAPVLQILAGPGSGKTRVLTVRIALAIQKRSIRPENLVVVTFTNKAARELKDRLTALIGQALSQRLIIGTFHSVAYRFLQRYGKNIGLDRNMRIADSGESRNLIARLLKELRKNNNSAASRKSTVSLEEDKQFSPASYMSYISSLKGLSITPAQLRAEEKLTLPFKLGVTARQELCLIYEGYQEYLQKNHLLDFDDLISYCIDLLRAHSSIVNHIRHVFVDEYQDTSMQQYTLMNMLAQANKSVTVVGDHDQSIYGFRAADILNFARMHDSYAACTVFHLTENYRSSGAIVSAALALIEQDSQRPAKSLQTSNKFGPRPTLRCLQTSKTEADWIATEVCRLTTETGQLLSSSDIAILVRSASLTLPIEQALQRHKLKYRLTNAKKFLERPHIKIIIQYLKVIQDEASISLLEVLNVPPRRIGQISMDNFQLRSANIGRNLWQTLVLVSKGSILLSQKRDAQMEQKLCKLVRVIEGARAMLRNDSETTMEELILYLVQNLQLDTWLRTHYSEDATERQEDIQEFIHTADILADPTDEVQLPDIPQLMNNDLEKEGRLSRLLSALSLMSDTGVADGTDLVQQITITTIHSAKGLEWPVVFIPGVFHGSIPSSRVVEGEEDEERRLLYVAMSRAQALLYMSYPLKSARLESVKLSSFLCHSSMGPFLQERGPELSLIILEELAAILGRIPPDLSFGHLTTDMYEDRTEAQLMDAENASSLTLNNHAKRKPEDVQTMNIGFLSASKVLESLPPEKINAKERVKGRKLGRCTMAQQQGIQAYFAKRSPHSQQVKAPLKLAPVAGGLSETEDYRVVLLSSSPERGSQHDRRPEPRLVGQVNHETESSENIFSYKTILTENTPQIAGSDALAVNKPQKKRLGMSRPRIERPA